MSTADFAKRIFGPETETAIEEEKHLTAFAVCRRLLQIPGDPTPNMMIREILSESPYRIRRCLESLGVVLTRIPTADDIGRPLFAACTRLDMELKVIGMSRATAGPVTVEFVRCDADMTWVHGSVLDGREELTVLSTEGSDKAESLLLGCRAALLELMSVCPWFKKEMKGFLPSSGLPSECLRDVPIQGEVYLRKHRFDIILLLCRLMKQRMKDAGPMETREEILNRDLKGKTKRTRNMEWNSPFRDHFLKVEFDNSVTAEMADEMAETFVQMLDADLLPRIPKTYKLRFRRFVRRNDAGVHIPATRTIVVSTELPGCFVHEYIHAYTNEMHYCDGRIFRPILERYRSLIDETEYDRKFRDYLKIPTEVYSRCFEMFLYRTIGSSVLQRSTDGSAQFPSDPDFVRSVMDYFTALRENGWKERRV